MNIGLSHVLALGASCALLSLGCGSDALVIPDAACAAADAAAAVDLRLPPDVIERTDASGTLTTPWIIVKGGLVVDLDDAIGTNSVGDRVIGRGVEILAGYGVDYVALDHVGRVSAPWGEPEVGQPLIVNIGGNSFYPDSPTLPPHRDYAPARALFDAMKNGPRAGDDQTGTRESPRGRVHCEVRADVYWAACYLTGVVGAIF